MSVNDTDMQTFAGIFEHWKRQNAIDEITDLTDGQVVSGIVKKGEKHAIQVTSRCGDKYIINYKTACKSHQNGGRDIKRQLFRPN